MPLQGKRELILFNAAAVVGNDDALDAALVKAHLDSARARVNGVFNELLDDRGRPLDHLAGGNLAHEPVTQRSDRAPRAGGDEICFDICTAICALKLLRLRHQKKNEKASEGAPARRRAQPWKINTVEILAAGAPLSESEERA